jgi:type I restriction enzyme S subunit
MTPETFLKEFGALAETPGGVAKLREMVLELAVRGRLVEQDAGEEPAEALMRKIQRKRTCPTESDTPFSPAPGWMWTLLRELGAEGDESVSDGPFGSKLKTAHYVSSSDYRVIRLGNIGHGFFKDIDKTFIRKSHFDSLRPYHLEPGDIVVASLGNPSGRACEVPASVLPALHKADCFRVRLHPLLERRFILIVLNSPFGISRAADLNRGDTRGRITLTHLRTAPIPLPPLPEQHRIVAKVDQLMALCDELEVRQTKRREVSVRATKASLAALTEAQEPKDVRASWKRLSGRFDGLFDNVENVGELRQAILELAVRGRLLAQEPSGGSPPHVADSSVEAELVPYEVPGGWAWVRVGALGRFIGGGTPSKSNPSFWKGSIPWVSPKDMKVRYIADAQDHISRAAVGSSAAKLIPEGALLMVLRGMILAHSFPVALTTAEVTVNQDMKALVLDDPELGEYLLRAFQASRSRMLANVLRSSHGTCRLETAAVESFPIPLPPLVEQKRIVAKVDQLMALCDDLEGKLKLSDEWGGKLMKAVVEAMVGVENARFEAT